MNMNTLFALNRTPAIVMRAAAGFVLSSSLLVSQIKSVGVTVNGGRPLAKAAAQLERLSGIPINYEDVRYENQAEVEDVTDKVTRPEQRAMAPRPVRIMVPRGGELSISVQLDPVTGRLTDVLSPLNALLAAHLSKGLPGVYTVESANDGAFFITPSQVRDARGALVATKSVLVTPVTFSFARRNGAETLQLVLDQVLKVSGFKIGMGDVPLNGLIHTEVAIGADSEPARDVLVRLLASVVSGASVAGRASSAISYKLLFDPGLRYYMFNAAVVPAPLAPAVMAPVPSPPPTSDSGRFFQKSGAP